MIEILAARADIQFIGPAVSAQRSAVDPEGDVTHQANIARALYGVDGTGVKVGVLSDSVTYLATAQSNGSLPAVTVLAGQSGTNDMRVVGEGTALLEIVHAIAPGAQLVFRDRVRRGSQFAQNIRDLATAGCNIIVDDLMYQDESPFQDGIVAQAIDAVATNGVLYFSATAIRAISTAAIPLRGRVISRMAAPPRGWSEAKAATSTVSARRTTI